jgi:mono/diheme cytochrome c family protein
MVSRSLGLILLLAIPLSAEVRDLKAFFQERCAGCHGPDGSGRSANGVRLGGRNLIDPRWLAKQEEPALVASILKGRGAMPGFRRQLDEGEARRLLTDVTRPQSTRKKT